MDPLDNALLRILPSNVLAGLIVHDQDPSIVAEISKRIQGSARGIYRRMGFVLRVYNADEYVTEFTVGTDSREPYALQGTTSTDPDFLFDSARDQLDTWLQFCLKGTLTSPFTYDDFDYAQQKKDEQLAHDESMARVYERYIRERRGGVNQ